MSIWGRRVDQWFDQKTGAGKATREGYNGMGMQLAAVVAVLVVTVLLILLLQAADL